MNLRMTSGFRKLVLMVILISLLFNLSPAFLEGGSCENAFFQCWIENLWFPDFAAVYCTTGYLFCRKYVAK